MCDIPVVVVIEDDLSLSIVKRLISNIDTRYYIDKFIPETRRVTISRGNGYITKKIRAFNDAARYQNFIILTDLDNKTCAPEYVNELLNDINENLLLQIAVREVESWLIADRKNLSSYLCVSEALFKYEPEEIDDPKQFLFSIVKRSRSRQIKEGILPKDSTARFGPMYNQILMKFVYSLWDYNIAKKRSLSLNRFINKLET